MTNRSATHHHHRDDEDTVTATADLQSDDDLIPLEEVKRLAGIGKTMIYRLERAKAFPQRYKPGGYASRWSRREVMKWREDQRQVRPS